jgi:endonuclease/exonuclease/phosphatase family metal-dependent hydrolase
MSLNKYYIGYSVHDNYFYSLTYSDINNIIKIDGNIAIKNKINNKIEISVNNYIYIGNLNSNSFYGNIIWKYGTLTRDFGIFYCDNVSKKEYDYYYTFKNPYKWFINKNKIKSIKPIIYHMLTNTVDIQFTVMSFNVCSSFIWTSEYGMKKVAKMIAKNNPDIVCLQEISPKLITNLCKMTNKYSMNFIPNNDNCILTKYEPVKTYKRSLLSPIYGLQIEPKPKIKIRIFNSHLTDIGFDDEKQSQNIQQPQLNIGLYTNVYANDPELPAIMAGDFNMISHLDDNKKWNMSKKLESDGWIDTYRETNKKINMSKDSTYPNCNTIKAIHINETGDQYCPNKSKHKNYRIDYIYSKNGKKISLQSIESYVVNTDGAKFPSDHNAVVTKFQVLI